MKQLTTELLALDVKDQKILAQLFKNGRAQYSAIAKATLVSEDAVKYRIAQLIKSGVMTNVNTIINIKKLGWSSAVVLFKLINLDKARISSFISYLVKSPVVVEILEFAGGWDFAVRFYHRDNAHLNALINALETKFTNLIDNYSIFFVSDIILLPYNVLFEKYKLSNTELRYKACKIDKLDLRILSAISYDARKSYAQLMKELKQNRMTIHNRIKKMLDTGIIRSFRPNLYTEKLGYHWYWISMKLNSCSESKIKLVNNKLKEIMQTHMITNGFGVTNIIFYIQVKTVQELQKILYSLREEFSKDIKSIESANIIKDYKWDFFPKGFLEFASDYGNSG